MDTDEFDRRLRNAAPATRLTLSPRARRALSRGARHEVRGHASRTSRIVLGVGLTLALTGGGTAAAFANEDIRDWFLSGLQDSYVTTQYTLPSGATCTVSSGDVVSNDPAAEDALRTWLASADLMSLVDVDGALTQLRSYDEYDKSQIGSDGEYQMAMEVAVVLSAREELASQGYPRGAIDQWKSENECTEPDQ